MSAADSYQEIWDETNVADAYLTRAYHELCVLYADATHEGQAVIQTIS